jgi:hypothetical membrane protein
MENKIEGDLMSKGSLKLLAICGIIGPIWFHVIVYILGAMYPGYDHVTQFMSELGAVGSPVAGVFNSLGIGAYGLLTIAFSYGLYRGIKGSLFGPALLAISGFSMIMLGIYPLGPTTTDMHVKFFYVLAISSSLYLFAFVRCVWSDDRWRDMWKYLLIIAVLAVIALIIHQSRIFAPAVGLTQRIWVAIIGIWYIVMGIRLLRLNK